MFKVEATRNACRFFVLAGKSAGLLFTRIWKKREINAVACENVEKRFLEKKNVERKNERAEIARSGLEIGNGAGTEDEQRRFLFLPRSVRL